MKFRRPLILCALTGMSMLLSGCGRMNAFVMNDLGHRKYKAGNYSAAQRYFHMASADNPQSADYAHNLATTLRKQGQHAQAETLFRQAINIDPMHQPSYHGLASVLKDQGRANEGKELLAMWADTQTYIAEPQIELAWFNRETGNLAESEANLRQALKIEPTNATALAHLGQVYQDQGRGPEAVAMYRRSLYQNWYQPQVQSRVAGLGAGAQPGWGPTQTFAAQPGPVLVQQPFGTQAVTLMPPIPAGSTASAAAQPVQLGLPITNADPAHNEERVGAVPVVEAR